MQSAAFPAQDGKLKEKGTTNHSHHPPCARYIRMFSDLVTGAEVHCSHSGCPATVNACPETIGNHSLVAYCIRAQGWGKAKCSSYVYCQAHRTTDMPYGRDTNDVRCLLRHTGGTASAAVTPQPRPPASPPFDLEQCRDNRCSAGLQVCGVCRTRMIEWSADARALTPLAAHTLQLIDTLNCLPAYAFPAEFVCDTTDESLRRLGKHDPEAGQGDDREADAGNKAGSALMLAALFPRVYGIDTAGPLRIFGAPPPQCLAVIGSTKAKSGKGPDNRRHNVWEALLNHWQDEATMASVRDLTAQTLYEMRVAIEMVVDRDNTKLVWELPRPALLCRAPLPVGNNERGLYGHMV